MKKNSVFLLLLLLFLTACENKADEPDSPPPAENTRPFALYSNGLHPDSGPWTMQPDSLNIQTSSATILLTATYDHEASPVPAALTLTVYRTADEAAAAYAALLESWQSDSTNTVKEIGALGQQTHLLNDHQAGMILDVDGIVSVTFTPEAAHTQAELLHLMQVGLAGLRYRDTPSSDPVPDLRDSLGPATLAAPGSEESEGTSE